MTVYINNSWQWGRYWWIGYHFLDVGRITFMWKDEKACREALEDSNA